MYAGNSGKSTILKQMRIIHGANYTSNEKIKYKPLIIHNILESIIRLVNAMRQIFLLEFEKETNEEGWMKSMHRN